MSTYNMMSGFVRKILNSAITVDYAKQLELIRLSKLGDKNALEKLTLANVKFIVSRVFYFVRDWNLPKYNKDDFFEDIVTAGIEGMYIAVQKFDEEKGNFLTYARCYIDKYIRIALHEEYGKHSVGNMPVISFDDIIDDEGEGTTLLSILPDDGPSVEEILEKKETIIEICHAIAKLDERSRDIFIGKVSGKRSHREFCKKYNICDERVRQIFNNTRSSISYSIAC